MRPRTRAAGIAACALLSAIAVGAAVSLQATGSDAAALWHSPDAGSATQRQGTTGQVATATKAAPPAGALPADQAIRELRTGRKRPAIRVDAAGAVRSVAAAPGQTLKPVPGTPAGAGAETVAKGFVARYAAAFGMTAKHTIRAQRAVRLPGGDQVVRFDQYAGGLPVLGGQVVVTVRANGGVVGASAETAGLTPVATSAKVSAAEAGRNAITSAAETLGLAAADLEVGETKLWLYDPGLVGAVGRAALRPTWWVELHDRAEPAGHRAASVLVDALDGSVALVMSEHREAKNRIICDLANSAGRNLNDPASYACPGPPAAVVRREGEGPVSVPPGDTTNKADINKAYDYLGAAYDFYRSNFGRDSYDGRGTQVRATVRTCHVRCPFHNAFWDGRQLVFGPGMVTDDVAAHEYAHAVTDHASQLIYVFQSGAINEALSDIMGEFLDQSTGSDDDSQWLIGEDLSIGPIRSMSNPGSTRQPEVVGGPMWRRVSYADDNGGVHTNSGVANKVAQVLGTPGAQTYQGQSVTGLGLPKSIQLWYRVMHTLPSGANYDDLGDALTASCYQLVGFYGFTPANCANVTTVTGIAGMRSQYQSQTSTGVALAPLCDGSAAAAVQPTRDLFYDGMEQSGKWRLSSEYWQRIPSAAVPYRYAHSGQGSLNGWTTPSGSGNGSTAEMINSVPIPAWSNAQPTYLWFAHSTPIDGSTGWVQIQVHDGTAAGWQPLTATAVQGAPIQSGGEIVPMWGYGVSRVELRPYAGKSVRFRFVLRTATTGSANNVDFYADDFRIYQCEQRPSAPANAYGYLNGSTATVGWEWPTYRPSDSSIDHYQLTFNPPVPGAPSTVPGNASNTISIPGFTPGVRYSVTIRAVEADGDVGEPAVVRVAATAPVSCPTRNGFTFSWSGSRPRPTPEGQCFPAPPPRRR